MLFLFRYWDVFCRKLRERGLVSIPAQEAKNISGTCLVLKHDVETAVSRAYEIACIEHRHGHRGSYYVQAYLLEDPENIALLKRMQDMGHEITYHHDVMDSCRGDLPAAIREFDSNCQLFETNGFPVTTVCQHGNPIVDRVGYHSNRDFFRSPQVQALYPDICDIMVNYPKTLQKEVRYYSDAGRTFQWIYDPICNDQVNSDDKNIVYEDLDALLAAVSAENGGIISIHPHRWTRSAVSYTVKTAVFKTVRFVAKRLARIPFFKRIMARYYHLAKKI